MSISGIVVHSDPREIETIRERLTELDGVEIHAVTEEGRFVVTVDQPDDRKASDTFLAVQNTPGVLSTSLVYNYFEQADAEKEQI